jgi:hypothetical protein
MEETKGERRAAKARKKRLGHQGIGSSKTRPGTEEETRLHVKKAKAEKRKAKK